MRDDLWSIGVTPDRTAIELVREGLARRGVATIAQALESAPSSKVVVAGVVTHRQQPETAHVGARWRVAVNVVAERFEPIELGPVPGSRDFR